MLSAQLFYKFLALHLNCTVQKGYIRRLARLTKVRTFIYALITSKFLFTFCNIIYLHTRIFSFTVRNIWKCWHQ